MERRLSVIPRCLTTAALALLFFLPRLGAAEETVVLATSTTCPVSTISALDVRKVYLGVSLRLEGQNIRPLRVNNDEKLNQVFFQSVVAMSKKSYERRLLSLALKFGTPRPIEYARLEDAVAALGRTRCSVVYGWSDDFDDAENVKVIRVLWQG